MTAARSALRDLVPVPGTQRRGGVLLALLVALLGTAPAPAPATVAALRIDNPRDYAWFIGDHLTRRISLEAAPGFELDRERLPQTGEVNHWLDLTAVTVSGRGPRARISLTYRITNAVEGAQAQTRTIPGWSLYTRRGQRRVPTNVPEWSFTQVPVVPASAAEFLTAADVRADAPPAPAPWSAHFVRVAMLGLAVVVLALYLFYCHYGAVWVARWRRPFTAALRDLRREAGRAADPARPGTEDAAAIEAALTRFHTAVNEAAGRVVMRNDLDAFFAQQPLYASERTAITRIYDWSNRLFFGAAERRGEGSVQELVDICRRLSVLELSTP